MFKVKYVDSIMMLVRLDLNLIVSLFQHKCEVSETVSTTTLRKTIQLNVIDYFKQHSGVIFRMPGRGAKLVTMLVVRAHIWSTMPWYGLQQAGTLHVGNRLLVWITAGWHTSCR